MKLFTRYISLILLSLFLADTIAEAQINGLQSPMANLPAGPEAAALKEYVDIPVNEYTGTAGINIPLYTLQTKEVSVPISVSYHSAGNRVTEEASWVGLGWSLNAGGVITREIRDKDDFGFRHRETGASYPGYYSNFDNQIDRLPGHPIDQPFGNLIPLDPIENNSNFTVHVDPMVSTENYIGNDGNPYTPGDDLCKYSEIDLEPDVFAFNFMGYSGKFVLNDDKVFIPLTDHGLKITYENPGWKITAQDGTVFLFGTVDAARQKTYSKTYNFRAPTPNGPIYNYNCDNCLPIDEAENYTFSHISSWFLREIQTVNGRRIIFNYDKEPYEPFSGVNGIQPVPGFSENWLHIYHSCFLDCGVPNVNIPENQRSASVSLVRYDRVDLANISSPSPDIEERIFFHTKTGVREDLKGGKVLERIEVKIGNNPYKEFIFNTDYFASDAPKPLNDWAELVDDLPDISVLITDNNNLKRLKLNSIEFCGVNDFCLEKPYTFSYNEATKLPAKTSMSQDYWGFYNNAADNRNLIPSVYYVRDVIEPSGSTSCTLTCEETINGSCTISSIVAADRKAKEEPTKAFILESIFSPIGGSTTFDYEMHRFNNAGDDLKFNSQLNELGLSLFTDFPCFDPLDPDPPCDDDDLLMQNYPNLEVVVGENGANLCGIDGVPVFINATWASIGCNDLNAFPAFLEVDITGISDPSFSTTLTLDPTTFLTNPGDTWTGRYEAYFGLDILLPPTIFLDPGTYNFSMNVPLGLQNCGATFSASINVAELELTSLFKQGGGLRVAKKTTNDANGNILTTNFSYVDPNGNSTGILNSIPDFTGEAGIRIGEGEIYNGLLNTAYAYQVNIASSSLAPLSWMHAQGIVGYTTVTKEYEDQDEVKYGSEVSTYANEDFSTSTTSSNYTVLGVPRFFNANNGNLLKKEVYDINGLKVKEIVNEYSTNWNEFDWIWTGKVMCNNCLLPLLFRDETGNYFPAEPNCGLSHQLKMIYYSHIPQWHKLTSTTESIWGTDGSGPVVTTSSYTYDNQYFVPKTYSVSGASVGMTTEIKYAQDILSEGDPHISSLALSEMLNRNMTAVPLWEKTTGSVQKGSKTRYELLGSNNLIVPTYFYAIEGDINVWEPQFQLFYDNDTDDYPDQMLKEAYTIPELYSWDKGLLESKTYDQWTWTWGHNLLRQLSSSTDMDGTGISYTYDDLHRLQTTEVLGNGTPSQTKSLTTYQYQYQLAGGGENKVASETTYPDGTDAQKAEQTFDGFGRSLLTRRLDYTPNQGDKVIQSVKYDGFGRPVIKYAIGSDPVAYQYEFSPLSRMQQVDHPDGSIVTMSYGSNEDLEVNSFPANSLYKIKTIDENGNESEVFQDGLERTRLSREHLSETESADTYFAFDGYGNIGTVTTPLEYVYNYMYDEHNRLSQKTIPGGGATEYFYYDNDFLELTILPNGHRTYNYYDTYDRLRVTSLDGPEGPSTNIIENTYDNNFGASNSAFNGKLSTQRVRVLGTNDWLSTDFTYDAFGRVVAQAADNYVNGSDDISTSYDNADNIKNIMREHTSSYVPSLDISTTNIIDHAFRVTRVEHGVDAFPVVDICRMGYDNEDRPWVKRLSGNDPAGTVLQTINYGYNSRGWLTNINQVDDGDSNNETIAICDPAEDCYKCDYRAQFNMLGTQIFGIYTTGGMLVDINYPYDLIQLGLLEVDLENWLDQNNIPYQDVLIGQDGPTVAITILQTSIEFEYLYNWPNEFVEFDQSNCTGTPPSDPPAEICALCNQNGYKCNDCPYWNIQDECTTCQELGILNCSSCAFDNDPCTRCLNLGYTDCAICPLTLEGIKPIRVTVDYNYSDLAAGVQASMIKVTEESKYYDHDLFYELVEKQSTQVVGSTGMSNNSPTHTMSVDMSAHWINADSDQAILDSLETALIVELNTAGITNTQTQTDFVDAVEQSLNITWKNTTGITPQPNGSIDNPDLFAIELTYGGGDDLVESPGQFNGNISGMTWKVAGKAIQNYSFWYDPLDRLKEGLFKEVQNGLYSTDNLYGVEMDYDLEGNIDWLKRRGVTNICDEGSGQFSYEFDQIDFLTYVYDNNNHLESIIEGSNQDYGYKGAGGDYDYNGAGNLTVDQNKKMTVMYNYLNLPEIITFNTTGNTIQIIYDAMGNKLRKIVDGAVEKEYSGEIEYSGGEVEAIYHQEGRVTYNGPKPQYEYFLRDHLGNTRVVFSDLNQDGYLQPFNAGGNSLPVGSTYTEILQESHYYPFGMEMNGPWKEMVNTPENAYLYNGKELNDNFGLDWLDYGARWYDPAIGRWHAVDPLAEQYLNLSPYHFSGDNPIRFYDVDGRYFTGNEKLLNRIIKRLENIGTDEAKAFLDHLDRMRVSDIEFHINILDTRSPDGKGGEAYFNFDKNRVEIDVYSGIGIDFETSDESRGMHELEHGRQFMDGELDFIEGVKGVPGAGDAYDQSDEENAFKAQNIIGAAEGKPIDPKKEVKENYFHVDKHPANVHSAEASIARQKSWKKIGGKYMTKYLYVPTEQQIEEKRSKQ